MEEIMPILGVEHDCLLSKQGDITVVYKVELPEIFTLSNHDYEAFHQTLVKAIKVLPKHCVLHKQDWFIDKKYKAEPKEEDSFLGRSSDRFFLDRPFLEHTCYILLTKKPGNRKVSSSLFNNLTRPTLVPEQTINHQLLQDFLDKCSQFSRILADSGFVKMKRLKAEDLLSGPKKVGFLEKYLTLSEDEKVPLIRDIQFQNGIQIGDHHVQVYTLADTESLPALCGSRINYDKYSSDRTKFSVGFASVMGQLLPCSHIYNQYISIEDPAKTITKLETKRLRLQSLSGYSRENMIARDATNDFLNEAIGEQRLPVKSHFNITIWNEDKARLIELKNTISSSFAQMDAVAKQETDGAPQIFWAGIPGNAGEFPTNDMFDTFAEQATCFLNLETGYRSSISPIGIRLGDRLTGKPVMVDLSDEPLKLGLITQRNRFILGPSGGWRVVLN